MRWSTPRPCLPAVPAVRAAVLGSAVLAAALAALPRPADAAGPEALAPLAQATQGILKVTANVEGATVLIDGAEIGAVPLMTAHPAGDYEITVTAPGYDPFVKTISVTANKKVVVKASLEYNAGSIALTVSPDGASVMLDGELVGTTPDVDLSVVHAGSHKLIITKPGFDPYARTVTVERRRELAIDVALEANAGVLIVETKPAGASIHIDGEWVGSTPLTSVEIPLGLHNLRLTLDGYADKIFAANVELGEETRIEHAFREERGGLKISPTPPDAEITLDHYPLGSGEMELTSLEPGVHTVRLSAPGYMDYSEEVLIKEGKTTTLRTAMVQGGVTSSGGVKAGGNKKAAPVVVAIVGAVTTGTIIAIAASSAEGTEPPQPTTDYVFELP